MTDQRLARAGGYACIASAVLSIVALVGFFVVVGAQPIGEAATRPAFLFPTTAALAATVLLGVGLVGLHAYQRGRLGGTGVAAFLAALIGTMLAAGAQWTYVFVLPHFAAIDAGLVNVGSGSVLAGFLLSYAALAAGWLVFGVATLRTGVFRRGAVVALIVGAVLAVVPMPSRTLVLSVAAGVLGWRMLREKPPTGSPPL